MRLKPIEPFPFSILAILLVVVFVFQLVLLLFMASIYPAIGPPSRIRFIEDRMGVDFKLGRGEVVRARRATATELERGYPILLQEIARYNENIRKRMGLRQIVLCSGLTVEGKELSGLTVGSAGTILLNVGSLEPDQGAHFRRTIHHELFHVMDNILEPAAGVGDSWSSLNPKDFHYGGDEILSALEVTNESPGQRTDVPGFLNYYAMVSAREDRAELFASMMVESDSIENIELMDDAIARKIQWIKRELIEFSRDFAAILRLDFRTSGHG